QFKSYALSTQQGTVKLASNQVALNYNNPDQIDKGLQAIDAATYQAGKINGSAATEIEANQTAMKSNALTGAIDAALQQGQTTYANQLLAKYSSQMTADDILKVNGKLNTYMGTQVANQVVSGVMTAAGPQLSNSPLSRMQAITSASESSNNPNAVGPYIPGQGTAKGSMQVMDATNTDPGFGVRPAADNSQAERVRVGNDYLAAMVQRYGDPAKAWAAYNAGPGTLDAAMAKAQAAGTPGAWLQNMPPDTQAYVQKNVAAYQSGAEHTNTPVEKLADVIAQVHSDPVLQSKPEWMAAGRDARDAAIQRADPGDRPARHRSGGASAAHAVVESRELVVDQPGRSRRGQSEGSAGIADVREEHVGRHEHHEHRALSDPRHLAADHGRHDERPVADAGGESVGRRLQDAVEAARRPDQQHRFECTGQSEPARGERNAVAAPAVDGRQSVSEIDGLQFRPRRRVAGRRDPPIRERQHSRRAAPGGQEIH
ncbi:MAG: transglycosylase SLT domain-containing protein, partial [Acidobacteriaceae bacterium]|nr:transglycosylase SLT domain-containing protein [Acidobacteriaceae bacterium]